MARPRRTEDLAGVNVAFRITKEEADALDAYAKSCEQPGIQVSRNSAARSAMVRFLETLKTMEGMEKRLES